MARVTLSFVALLQAFLVHICWAQQSVSVEAMWQAYYEGNLDRVFEVRRQFDLSIDGYHSKKGRLTLAMEAAKNINWTARDPFGDLKRMIDNGASLSMCDTYYNTTLHHLLKSLPSIGAEHLLTPLQSKQLLSFVMAKVDGELALLSNYSNHRLLDLAIRGYQWELAQELLELSNISMETIYQVFSSRTKNLTNLVTEDTQWQGEWAPTSLVEKILEKYHSYHTQVDAKEIVRIALTAGRYDVLFFFLEKFDLPVDTPGKWNQITPLMAVVSSLRATPEEKLRLIDRLLSLGANIKQRDSVGQNVLHILSWPRTSSDSKSAASIDNGKKLEDLVDWMVAAGVNPEELDSSGRRPLVSALFRGEFEIARLLVKRTPILADTIGPALRQFSDSQNSSRGSIPVDLIKEIFRRGAGIINHDPIYFLSEAYRKQNLEVFGYLLDEVNDVTRIKDLAEYPLSPILKGAIYVYLATAFPLASDGDQILKRAVESVEMIPESERTGQFYSSLTAEISRNLWRRQNEPLGVELAVRARMNGWLTSKDRTAADNENRHRTWLPRRAQCASLFAK
jgi:hypothetical protein